jgi:hypothetical protein
MTTINNEKSLKSRDNYCCKCCNYSTSRNDQYERHLSTSKHKKTTNNNENSQKVNKNYECVNCCKKFNDRAGLWRHKKKCVEQHDTSNNDPTDKALMMMVIHQNAELMKKNDELQNMMMKVIEKGTHNTTNNTNSHNKAFNLNFFLNETCKDAMNITDFVESIKLQLSDLERVGEIGYVEGISNIIVKNLKGLDVTQRPVHCTDKKRETMYIKDENKWEKDEEQKKMHKMVRKVADKNARMLPKFKEAHPDCIKSTSLYSDQYNQIIMEAMGGKGDNDFEKEEKIIKNVSKEVLVEKC